VIGCVILTMGDRPTELERAVASIRRQREVEVDVLVVVNRADPVPVPDGVRTVVAGSNLGIPGGRNLGAGQVDGELILFLDDDAWLADDDILRRAWVAFEDEPELGVVSMRLMDPNGGEDQRRHVPRLRAGDPARSSQVTTFLGGASIVRRAAWERGGGFPASFRYAHEETSLAWRILEAGYRIRYRGDLVLHHPAASPARHAEYHFLSARNRVLLARAHLPLPLAVVYVTIWMVLSLVRSPGGWRDTLRGLRAGLRSPVDQPMRLSWPTIVRMTRAGRPPLL
jgi:GT2 family glycosyltransferase